MERIKVYELAKRYGLTNEQMMDFLLSNDVDIENHMSEIDISTLGTLVQKLEGNNRSIEHKNRTSLQRVKIEGLFGKYNYDITFENDICIWVSENGKGKTTILKLIVALLTGDKEIIGKTNFQKIEATVNGTVYEIDKTRLRNSTKEDILTERYFDIMREILPAPRFRHVLKEYKQTGNIDFEYIERFFHKYIYEADERYRYNKKHMYRMLHELKEIQFDDYSEKLYALKSSVTELPLFYPTYRRIEVALNKSFSDNSFSKYMCFGMADVQQRIDGLLKKMSDDAIDSYREMNGAIINELLKGYTMSELTKDIPNIDKHKVEVVIKRIGENNIDNIDELKQFVEGNKENPNEEFLIFYLDKLAKIYDSQKAIDDKLTRFANVCTKYLSGKKMKYDEVLLTLAVYDETGEKIELEDLSSGEKQIVSLFSKVYLDVTTSCIFVIDEPELSLSIEWQKEFLVDIYNSGKVGLLIATTHSPFIFKNEFRGFTVEMDMYKGEVNGINTNDGR